MIHVLPLGVSATRISLAPVATNAASSLTNRPDACLAHLARTETVKVCDLSRLTFIVLIYFVIFVRKKRLHKNWILEEIRNKVAY